MRSIVFVFAVLVLAACASTTAPQSTTRVIRNEQGHVIGHTEVVKGREVVTYYKPRFDSSGTVIAYEEPTRDGAVIRSVDGKRIGMRYNDLRSRGSNPASEGISITVPSAQGKTAP